LEDPAQHDRLAPPRVMPDYPDCELPGPHPPHRDEAWKWILAAAKRYAVEVSESGWRDLFKGGKARKR
jgi:hypothetical protein